MHQIYNKMLKIRCKKVINNKKKINMYKVMILKNQRMNFIYLKMIHHHKLYVSPKQMPKLLNNHK